MRIMGLVSDDAFEKELEVCGSPAKEEVPTRGRGEGRTEVSVELRKLIAERYIENGREAGIALAKEHGVSASSASAYAKGATSTSTYKEGDAELRKHTNQVKERIAGKARRRLIMSLNHITKEKLEGAKLRDLSTIAKDMSAIVKNMEPDVIKDVDNSTKVQVVIMAPPATKESDYPVIEVSE